MKIKLIKSHLIGGLLIVLSACAAVSTNQPEVSKIVKISDDLMGTWVESKDIGGDTLVITSENILWKRADSFNKGDYNFKSGQWSLVDDSTVVTFSDRNACKKDIVGFPADGPVQVTIKRKGEELILDISRTRIERAGFILTCPAVTQVFKKSSN